MEILGLRGWEGSPRGEVSSPRPIKGTCCQQSGSLTVAALLTGSRSSGFSRVDLLLLSPPTWRSREGATLCSPRLSTRQEWELQPPPGGQGICSRYLEFLCGRSRFLSIYLFTQHLCRFMWTDCSCYYTVVYNPMPHPSSWCSQWPSVSLVLAQLVPVEPPPGDAAERPAGGHGQAG